MKKTNKTKVITITALLSLSLIFSGCSAGSKHEQNESNTFVRSSSEFDISDNDRVFYEIFVGSFADSNGDGIGDLRGIIDKMDYLNDGDPASDKSLGIGGIWLTPIFLSPSYHKYDVTDYYTIDPDFGSPEDLAELIKICHERNVKLILDLPINHTSIENEYFKKFALAHRTNAPDDPFYDFYSYCGAGDTDTSRRFARIGSCDELYECNFDDSMPELNFDNEKVYETVTDIARHYLQLGVDGFRFDAAKYIYFGDDELSVSFWKRYTDDLKKDYPNIYIVSEVWDSSRISDKYLTAGRCFNFDSSQADGVIADTAMKGDAGKYCSYVESLTANVRSINPSDGPCLFISNHDMDRAAGYLTVASGYAQMAANLYILTPGSPFIYYGEEAGLRGSRGSANTDANRRLSMPWGDDSVASDPEGTTYDTGKKVEYTIAEQDDKDWSLLNHYRQLIKIRNDNPAIAHGEIISFSFPDSKVGGFVATYEGKDVCVIHNPSSSSFIGDIYEITGKRFTEINAYLGAEKAILEGDMITIGAQTSAVLR